MELVMSREKPTAEGRERGIVPSLPTGALRLVGPEAELELVGLDYIQRMVGDRSALATRRWVERLRARGFLRPVPLAGSRKLRFRKADVLALVSGSTPDPGGEKGKAPSVASAMAIS